MAYERKTWKDRRSEFPDRRKLKIISESETELIVDVYRNEGNVLQEGDAFNKDNMNDLEGRVESGLNEKTDIVKLTQAQYNAMGSGRPNKLYVIVG